MPQETDMFKTLRENGRRTRERWNRLFEDYEKKNSTDDELISYSILDIPENYDSCVNSDKSHSHSAVMTPKGVTCTDQEVVNVIETTLKSNLKQLILQREKVKIMCNYAVYPAIHAQVKKEIKRIRKLVSKSDVLSYIQLCVIPKEGMEDLIEGVLESHLSTHLLQQMQFLNKDENKFKCCNQMVIKEWAELTDFLLDEDVTIYAVNFLKKNNY